MNICPITYEPCGNKKYSENGLKLLSRGLTHLEDFPYTQEEQLLEAAARASKLSIQGVQPKLSAKLKVKEGVFEITDKGGEYILKPQNNLYPQLPENEDLTMRLAEEIGLEIPLHGLIYSKDQKLTYFIKRFDRYGKGKKCAVEDFAQLSGNNRNTKYNSSMENVAKIIETYCTFPAIEKIKLFKLTIFNFLIGNEDQHLKNFSLITKDNKIMFSPFYDLINTTIILPKPVEEIALPLKGKKNKLNRNILVEYWGKERLGLNEQIINQSLNLIDEKFVRWNELINKSFLSKDMKEKYIALLDERRKVIW
ncbi:MAG: HipA domain-containing protein [Ignavibacterium sp.]|jgi:serine/threonine-protein kinase HipA|uniref:HipA domain-containing protein n=1 Tax=Ignavibacterium sp. TaxID=2651167 RepID=UPI00329A1D94